MHRIAFSIATLFAIASPAMAANENVITQSKALAGNVTPGDTAGFPITINTPGAYVFGSGIDVPAGQWGIVVNANGVDIDMSGYTLSGNGNADYGIVSGYTDGRVHDGIITAFKAAGMYIRGNGWTVESMKIQRNSGAGIDATGARFTQVRGSVIASNGRIGISAGPSALVKDSSIANNSGSGILCVERCNVDGNTIEANGGVGVYLSSGIVIGNMIAANAQQGVYSALDTRVGLANNMIFDNYDGVKPQRVGGVDMHPNACGGGGC